MDDGGVGHSDNDGVHNDDGDDVDNGGDGAGEWRR
jgi:hypothetical protein